MGHLLIQGSFGDGPSPAAYSALQSSDRSVWVMKNEHSSNFLEVFRYPWLRAADPQSCSGFSSVDCSLLVK